MLRNEHTGCQPGGRPPSHCVAVSWIVGRDAASGSTPGGVWTPRANRCASSARTRRREWPARVERAERACGTSALDMPNRGYRYSKSGSLDRPNRADTMRPAAPPEEWRPLTPGDSESIDQLSRQESWTEAQYRRSRDNATARAPVHAWSQSFQCSYDGPLHDNPYGAVASQWWPSTCAVLA